MRCAILYDLCNLKNVKNAHAGVFLLVKLQASAYNFTKTNFPPQVFFTFLKCTNVTKSRKGSQNKGSYSNFAN